MQLTAIALALFGTLAASAPTTSGALRRDTTTDPFCYQKSPGIYEPTEGAIISQSITDYTCNNISILYCSGQYDKTRSIDTSVWLSQSSTGTGSGELLAKDVTPDDQDASAGFSSYRYNVSVCPSDGDYMTGPYILSVYETETGKL